MKRILLETDAKLILNEKLVLNEDDATISGNAELDNLINDREYEAAIKYVTKNATAESNTANIMSKIINSYLNYIFDNKTDVIEKIKKFGEAFEQELVEFGLPKKENLEKNPFLKFIFNISRDTEYKPNIFDKLDIDKYGAIHNACLDIDTNSVIKSLLTTPDDTNILYKADLYIQEPYWITKYIDLFIDCKNALEDGKIVNDQLKRCFYDDKNRLKSFTDIRNTIHEVDPELAKTKKQEQVKDYSGLSDKDQWEAANKLLRKTIKDLRDGGISLDNINAVLAQL